jgi:hypothetical protein
MQQPGCICPASGACHISVVETSPADLRPSPVERCANPIEWATLETSVVTRAPCTPMPAAPRAFLNGHRSVQIHVCQP